MNKQWSTKHYTENYLLSNMNTTGVNSGAPEGQAVPVSLVEPVVLLLNEPIIIWYGNRVRNQYKFVGWVYGV